MGKCWLYAYLGMAPAFVFSSDLVKEWYWINDAGGTWNESMMGISSWRDLDGVAGMPADGENVLMVLPYSMSFPGYTQPVVVNFTSNAPLSLNEMVICSENWFIQDEGFWSTVDQLDLTVMYEYVGGKYRGYSPPPAYHLPDPPGIFPKGKHYHGAGLMHVLQDLHIGTIEGAEGTYQLVGTGNLVVDGNTLIGYADTTGSAGVGTLWQTGGTHNTQFLDVFSPGNYLLEGGSLLTNAAIRVDGVFTQSGGNAHSLDYLYLRDAGTYLLSDGIVQTDVRSIINESSLFHQTGGTHVTPLLELTGADDLAYFRIDGGELLADSIIVRIGQIDQNGGSINVYGSVNKDTGSVIHYTMTGGSLSVGSGFPDHGSEFLLNSIFSHFRQEGASSSVSIDGQLKLTGGADYCLNDGALNVYPAINIESGYFQQNGGSVITKQIHSADYGLYYDMNGGTLTAADYIASAYTDDAGIFLAASTLFNLNGGAINTDQIINSGNFDWSAGSIDVQYAASGTWFDNNGHVRIHLDVAQTIHVRFNNRGTCVLAGEFEIDQSFYNYGTVFIEDYSQIDMIENFDNSGRVVLMGSLASMAASASARETASTKDIPPQTSTLRVRQDMILHENAYISANSQSALVVEGDLLNASRQSMLWDTSRAVLQLSGTGVQTVELAGESRSDPMLARKNNFAWGKVVVQPGAQVIFTDGNPHNKGTALYAGILDIQDRAQVDPDGGIISAISGDVDLVYDPIRQENAYLEGKSYSFASGTGGVTAVPEPVTASIALENDQAVVSFDSHSGVSYKILKSTDLQNFVVLDTVAGTGSRIEYNSPLGQDPTAFYMVSPVSGTSQAHL